MPEMWTYESLKRLHINVCDAVMFAFICDNFPSLKSLTIDALDKDIDNCQLMCISKLKKLEELKLKCGDGYRVLGDELLMHFMKNCPHVRRVNFIVLTDITHLSQFWPNLEESFRAYSVSDVTLEELSKCQNVKSIHIQDINISDNAFIKFIERSQNLEKIVMFKCNSITNRSLKYLMAKLKEIQDFMRFILGGKGGSGSFPELEMLGIGYSPMLRDALRC
ncbi:unnamed protein product [Didymodactylos carnosus]|uniref:Uncharacterized protein n=1 Tax=Didymodactylos carnosus TaxID=1234261 RepID=A0A8S2IBQ2_9BILA|nr:unnamed protein product [Didymodactylos carnosus]CAF3733384.1 unnamed protein product [Didymodactylos carnosus]